MGDQRHIIGRTVLELDSGTVADVWELQETMSRLLQNRAISDLEALFDDLATADEVIRFDHVEVDLGEFSPYALDEEFVPALVRVLREKLCDRILQAQLQNQAQSQLDDAPSHQNQASADWEVLLYFLQYGRLPWWQSETRWSTWQTRWQAVIANSSSWQQPLLQCLAKGSAAQRRLISQFPKDFCHQLIRQLHPSGEMGLTLMAQAHQLAVSLGLKPSFQALLDDVAIYLVFDELAAIASAAAFPTLRWLSRWLASLQQLQSVQSTVLFSRSARMRQWMSNVHQGWSSMSGTDSSTLAQVMAQQLKESLGNIPSAERAFWQQAIDQVFEVERSLQEDRPSPLSDDSQGPLSATESVGFEQLETTESPGSPEAGGMQSGDMVPESPGNDETNSSMAQETDSFGESLETVSPEAVAEGIWEPITFDLSAPEERLDLVFPQVSDNSSLNGGAWLSHEEEANGIYINQAGLVLLHPFLGAYLSGVGLLEDNGFCDAVAQQTAIYLLHYLATGQTSAPEYELVLPKLLCGWPLNEPIAPDIALADEALAEGENLLQTVIGYWEALKSTSPDGLREGFLQREGKLTRTGNLGWKLQVEQMAIDVLLTRLPWGVSMVKLPWMDELLTVEWT